ncbi:MAG: lipoyl(octanoyl) transferase LipB [Chloroflexota bacterium]|nr:lipoyl(octanoyl) transferase LipB [Chloroflexota bacterium]
MSTESIREIQGIRIGTVEYGKALDIQRFFHTRRKGNSTPDFLLLLEHDHVITVGRRADKSHVSADKETLDNLGLQVFDTDRGGEASYHGPGQVVGYPIINLRALSISPVKYVRILELSIVDTLNTLGIQAHLVDGETGVWVGGTPNEKRQSGVNPGGRKIAAIGVRISDGVSMHGFALNVSTDLSYFAHIIPCGMPNLAVTSVQAEIGTVISVEDCAEIIASKVAEKLDRNLIWADLADYELHVSNLT